MAAPETATTCPYCGVGCGVLAQPGGPDGRAALTVRGDPDHPANAGRLCSKGAALADVVGLSQRLLAPRVDGARAGWAQALDAVARGFRNAIDAHGPDSVALYASGQLLTEDYYVANKLMKGFIGSANIDTNSRLCMASSVAGQRRAFGSDTVPGIYEDLEKADLVVLAGSNLAWCHPVLYRRIADEKRARAERRRTPLRVVLIDPRRTMSADLADLHLPIAVDGDAALFAGLLRRIAAAGALDRTFLDAHTCGLRAALDAAAGCDAAAVARRCGVPLDAVETFYDWFVATERVVTVYSQGVNQSSGGTDKVNAIINCHLASGRIGRPGSGPFSVTGQPNAMGGREVGGLANVLAAHMDLDNTEQRRLVQQFWRAPRIAERPGLKAVELFRALRAGRVKALWVMATNPADSLPDSDQVGAALAACPFLVVSDVTAATDTARYADVLLPAAAWGEKNGTVTNSERVISRQRGFLTPPGEARPDWWIICEVAKRLGFGDAFDYAGPAEIFREHAALSAAGNRGARDFDIGAYRDIDADAYQRLTPFRWPARAGCANNANANANANVNDGRFFADGGFYTPDRRARLIAIRPPAERRTDPAYPLVLNSGRVRDHWHTLTRTGYSARLAAHLAEPFVELHPSDAERFGIAAADLVVVRSARGEIVVRALLSERARPGSVFAPMHWSDQFAARARVGALIEPRVDPLSGQPALKSAHVTIARFNAAVYAFAVLRDKPVRIDASYWALAKCAGGWRLELAYRVAPADWQNELRALCRAGDRDDPPGDLLSYRDAGRGQHRAALFDGAALYGALFADRRPVAAARRWAAQQLDIAHDSPLARARIIAGRGDDGRPDPGALVCSCYGVGVNAIAAAVGAGCDSVSAIGAALQAGTGCGSCRSEIRDIIHRCERQHVNTAPPLRAAG